MSTGKVLLGVLAGLAAGATLGILFAPDKGSVTRRKISDKSNDYAEELQHQFKAFVENITKQYETTKDEVMHGSNGKLKAEDALAEVNTHKY